MMTSSVPQPQQGFIWIPPAFGGDEGGYTFLKRMLEYAIKTNKNVIFGDGSRVFEYKYEPDHSVFLDGVRQLDVVQSKGIVAHRMDHDMSTYAVAMGVKELVREGKIKADAAAKPAKPGEHGLT
jgi:hypothetical protein